MKALTVRATLSVREFRAERERRGERVDVAPDGFRNFADAAYPEIFAMQFPNGIGWQKESSSVPRECPPSLPIDYETVTEMMLRVDGKAANKRGLKMTTDAHESYEIFANAFAKDAEAKEIAKFGSLRNAKSIEVIDNNTVDPYKFESEFLLCENGVGKPCVVRNVFKDGCYDVDLLDLFGEETLTVNDKAPARRSDKGDNKQNTLLVTAKRFKEYMKEYEKCDEDAKPVPFYNNVVANIFHSPRKNELVFREHASTLSSSGGRNRNDFTRDVQVFSEIKGIDEFATTSRRDDRKRFEIAQ